MQKRRVLIVDDDPMVRLAVDRQLDALGWDAYLVNNGEEAIRLLELRRITFDLILIDLQLPDLDGRAVAAAAAKLTPAARILFMASHVPLQPALESVTAPVLVKPFSTSALARALDDVRPLLDGGGRN